MSRNRQGASPQKKIHARNRGYQMQLRCLKQGLFLAFVAMQTQTGSSCDLGVSTNRSMKLFGAGAHGGERLQSDFLKGLRQAAHVVGSIRTATLYRATESESIRAWILANSDELKSAIERSTLEWNDDIEQAHCALVRDSDPYVIHLSRPRCQNITSTPKAGELIIHEAVHMLGIASESFAPAVAYTLYLAWEYGGHTLDHKLHSVTTEGAPQGRENHTGVWTGNELVVWGGITRNGESNTGGIYDHVLDRWRAVSTTNAPQARFGHTAVWSGTKMLVWGGAIRQGRRGQTVLHYANGGMFDPARNEWQNIASQGAPKARFLHTATWTGRAMAIVGGARQVSENRFEYLGDGHLFDPTQNSWSQMSTEGAPTARFNHTALWTGEVSNQLIVWGGQTVHKNGQAELSRDGAVFDLNTKRWRSMSTVNAPDPRYLHTAIWTGSHMIVWGGVGYHPTGYSRLNHGAIYHLESDQWQALNHTTAPVARDGHIAVWTGSHMLIFGGKNPVAIEPEETGYSVDHYQAVGLFDPKKNEWSTPVFNDVWMDRRFPAGIWTGHELVVWGGLGHRRSGRVLYP
jgi:N-acetylneuraminic acid mutarotase